MASVIAVTFTSHNISRGPSSPPRFSIAWSRREIHASTT
jgi:hypothetical protein